MHRNFLIALVVLSNLCLSANAASLVATCRNGNKTAANCPSSKLFFPTYKVSGGTAEFLYKIDQGSIGDIGESQARSLAEDMLVLWEDVSSLDFVRKGSGLLDEDIDSTNYTSILESNTTLGFSPVVWDDDGQITEDLFGSGASDNVLGFAGPSFFNITTNAIQSIAESQSVFNGLLFRGSNTGDSASQILSTFQTTILHEFAHMFGIDHTQGGNIDGYNNFEGDFTDIPVMFPAAANPNVKLLQDDIAAVKIGYPLSTDTNSFGTISGTLTEDGLPLEGASIVAFKIDDSNPRLNAVASPSDVDGAGSGSFELPGLLPGNYIIRAEAIDSSFTGGSAVGIHSPISPNQITEGFYTGEDNAVLETNNLTNAASSAEVITVSAGSSTNINFNLSATESSGGDSGNDGDDSNESNAEASFSIGGAAFKKSFFLKTSKTIKKKIKINNLNKALLNITISTDYPELISFNKGTEISFSKNQIKMKVIIASYLDFLEVFPNFDEEGAEITVTFTDNDTGYVDNGNSLFLL